MASNKSNKRLVTDEKKRARAADWVQDDTSTKATVHPVHSFLSIYILKQMNEYFCIDLGFRGGLLFFSSAKMLPEARVTQNMWRKVTRLVAPTPNSLFVGSE